MIFRLLQLKWTQFRRSPTFTKSMVQNVILGIFALYFLVHMVFLGFFLKEFLEHFGVVGDVLSLAITGLFYYALLDILMRYFIQKFPVLDLKPFLTLPIKKSTLGHNLLVRSIFNFYNILPLSFLIPFFFRSIVGHYPQVQVLGFVLISIGIILFNNFLVFYINKRMAIKSNWIGLLIIGVFILLFSEYKGYVSVFPFLENLASRVIVSPILCSIPVLLAGLMYFLSHRFFVQNFTLDTQKSTNQLFASTLPVGLFTRFGKAGILMDLEVKLMLRSKRARRLLLGSFLFLLYPLMMLDADGPSFMLIFNCLLVTGMFAMNHGQLMLSWNSLHFDLLQSRSYTYYDLFSAKYYLLAASCVLLFILSIPYIFISVDFIIFNVAMLFYCMTFPIYLHMFLAGFNSLRIDPNEVSAFNMNGFGAAHVLIMVPIMILPCLLFWIGSSVGGRSGGLFLIGFVGILGLLFHRQIIQRCVDYFDHNRYKIGAAFRKSQ